MGQRQDLEAAAAAGVITAEQVEPLHTFLASRAAAPAPSAPKGEEELRFIRNFHDVFLSIGIAIFAVGMVLGGFVLMGGEVNTQGVAFVFALAAAAQWGLAEVFAKRRRLFLPSIVLCLAFVGFVTAATAAVIGPALEDAFRGEWSQNGPDLDHAMGLLLLISTAAATAAAGGFWARFRLPFAVGLLGFSLALLAFFGLWLVAPKLVLDALPWWSLLSGIALFCVGVWFDARDPERRTLLSDNGFWLHFAAAPLILNGALSLATGSSYWSDRMGMGEPAMGSETMGAAITLAVVVVLGLISLLINRRALIVSALVTTGVSIAVLMNALGLDFGGLAAATLLVLGGVVLLLGAGWHSARRALLGWVKPDGFWARIFPPEAAPE